MSSAYCAGCLKLSWAIFSFCKGIISTAGRSLYYIWLLTQCLFNYYCLLMSEHHYDWLWSETNSSSYTKWSHVCPCFHPPRSTKSSTSRSSLWRWLLAPCSTWHAAGSGPSWRAAYTRWSPNWACPPSSRTTCCWSSEATSTETGFCVESECCSLCEKGAAVHNIITVQIMIKNSDINCSIILAFHIFLKRIFFFMRENRLLVLWHSDYRSVFSAHVWRFTTRGSYRLELIKNENRYLIVCFIFY